MTPGCCPIWRSVISGSGDLFNKRGRKPWASINFVTAHDGFNLNDLVSYNDKHNEANGEDNRDGHSNNHSWNHGVEGPTDDPDILELRERQKRNLWPPCCSPRHADAAGGRRVRPYAKRQQQCLCAGQRHQLAELARHTVARPGVAGIHPPPDRHREKRFQFSTAAASWSARATRSSTSPTSAG